MPTEQQISAFLDAAALPPVTPDLQQPGRLIFIMDATASRASTWRQASQIQGEMFNVTASSARRLTVQLVFYRSWQCKASGWSQDADTLWRWMLAVRCQGGRTQIARALSHALKQAQQHPIAAVVFVGDCVEEDPNQLYNLSGQLRLLNIPLFCFHEGSQMPDRQIFEQLARISGGSCCSFDHRSASQLRDLLAAVAVFATGGWHALQSYSRNQSPQVQHLTNQLLRS